VARGIGRENLLRTLEGRGTIRLRDAELRGFDLRATDLENSLRWGTSRFTSAEGAFSMANGKIKVEQLRLTNRAEGYQAKGSVDFSRRLDLEIEPAQRQENGGAPGAAHNGFRITGPLDAPQWMRPEPPLAQR
jgi:AsmA-like C-terminal region